MNESVQIARVRVMVEIALMAALAIVLSNIKLFRMPYGGSLSLEMIPVFYVAARYGGVAGCLTGLLLGLGQLFFGPYVVHPAQLVLDYPLAFALIGVGGFIPARNLFLTEAGVILGSLLRYAAHVISGVIFFSEYAPEGSNVWIYSLGYNVSYLIPQVILALIVVYPIIRLMSRFDGGRSDAGPGRGNKK